MKMFTVGFFAAGLSMFFLFPLAVTLILVAGA
jgi:hypothetical protein